MIKLDYKGNLKKDIEVANMGYDVKAGITLKDVGICALSSLAVLGLASFISKDQLISILSAGVSMSAATMVIAKINVKKKVKEIGRKKREASERLEVFSEYLDRNGIKVDKEALVTAKSETRVFSYQTPEGEKVYDKLERTYVVDREEQVHTLVRLRNRLAELVNKDKVRIAIRQNVQENNTTYSNVEYGMYLLEEKDMASIPVSAMEAYDKLGIEATSYETQAKICERMCIGVLPLEDESVKRLKAH